MSFDPQRLRDYRFAPVHQHLTQRDLMLYALGVGFGADPLDAGQLRYVYEDGLRAVPTMAITLGYPNTLREFAAATGIRAEMVLHVSQNFTLHRPLPLHRTQPPKRRRRPRPRPRPTAARWTMTRMA